MLIEHIKTFRIWDSVQQKYVYKSYGNPNWNIINLYQHDSNFKIEFWIDKRCEFGEKIFENDIVQLINKYGGISTGWVYWDSTDLMFKIYPIKIGIYSYPGSDRIYNLEFYLMDGDNFYWEELKIIGTTHDKMIYTCIENKNERKD